jgi:hypothetical protein
MSQALARRKEMQNVFDALRILESISFQDSTRDHSTSILKHTRKRSFAGGTSQRDRKKARKQTAPVDMRPFLALDEFVPQDREEAEILTLKLMQKLLNQFLVRNPCRPRRVSLIDTLIAVLPVEASDPRSS